LKKRKACQATGLIVKQSTSGRRQDFLKVS
jgi:hypothetical protein